MGVVEALALLILLRKKPLDDGSDLGGGQDSNGGYGFVLPGLVSVKPDPRDPERPGGRNIMKPTAGDMFPIPPAHAGHFCETLEMHRLGLIGANLFRGDHQIEWLPEGTLSLRKK